MAKQVLNHSEKCPKCHIPLTSGGILEWGTLDHPEHAELWMCPRCEYTEEEYARK